MRTTKTWFGDPPTACDLCKGDVSTAFVDGATHYNSPARGRWACMCLKCHKRHGVGLGMGMGQQYELDRAANAWVKVQG